MNSPAVVSVVIPTHNRVATIRQAIESAFAQTLPPLEVIVVDDGSTDGTSATIADVQTQWGSRLSLLTQAHAERSVARNRGIAAAKGEYVAFLDSDDLWRSEHLRQCLESIAATTDAIGAVADYGKMSNDGRVIRDHVRRTGEHGGRARSIALDDDDTFIRSLIAMRIIIHPSEVVVARRALVSVGGFDPRLMAGEDWVLWVQLAAAGRLTMTQSPTVWLRTSPDNTFSRPQEFAQSIIRAAEGVIDTGLPARTGVPDSQIRAIARVHASAAYARSDRPSRAVRPLVRAIDHYPPVVADRQFWLPVRRLVLGRKVSNALSRRRWSPRGEDGV